MPIIKYKFHDGHAQDIEVSAEVAAFLAESERQERASKKQMDKYTVSLELLKTRERRVLQSGRRERSHNRDLYPDNRADPYEVLRERNILEEILKLEEQ